MVNHKLFSLFAIILLTSSSVILAGAFLSCASGRDYTLMDNPFPFATETPPPTATPEPTATPIPTPKPEPTAKPTLTVECTSTASSSNPTVQVAGTLSYNKTGIPTAAITLSYSADAGLNWTAFSLAQTRSDGSYSTVWTPTVTGNYIVCAAWDGNDTLHWMNATLNLALTPDNTGNVFSATSNSTITNLTYDASTQILRFDTNGTSQTAYINICIPKSLVSDIQTVTLKIDGQTSAFGSKTQDDVYLLSAYVDAGEHAFSVQVPFAEILAPAQTPWLTIVIAIVALVVVVAVVVVVRRRRRTAASVAAILKENRPTY